MSKEVNENAKTNTKGNTQQELTEEDELKVIAEASKKVNDTLNYVNEYKKQGLKANANDVMNLYKVVSDYEKKISNFRRNPGDVGGNNNNSKYIDIVARREDARENKRNIAKVISASMDEFLLDAKGYKNKLNEKLTAQERENQETKELLAALDNYAKLASDRETVEAKKSVRADAKQRLIDACIGYVKNTKNNEAKTVIYDIAAIMGKQSISAFKKLSDKDLSEMSTRRHIGYAHNTTGEILAHHTALSHPSDGFVKGSDIVSKLGPDSKLTQAEKDEEYDKYMINIYANDRFARFSKEEYDQADKELGKNATEEEKQLKVAEIAYKNAPWNKIKLDETTKSKDTFSKRQKVMRQWFPDDSRLLYGPTSEKLTIKKFYDVLDNGEYNGLVRSMKNSPEYTALLKSLKTYTKGTDIAKDESNYNAVKDACVKYLDHYKAKEEKSEFAQMRAEKVKELLEVLGGDDKEISKNARGNAEKMNATELVNGSKKSVGKTSKQSYSKSKGKELGNGKQ